MWDSFYELTPLTRDVTCFKIYRDRKYIGIIFKPEWWSSHSLYRWFIFDNSISTQLWENMLPDQLCLLWVWRSFPFLTKHVFTTTVYRTLPPEIIVYWLYAFTWNACGLLLAASDIFTNVTLITDIGGS